MSKDDGDSVEVDEEAEFDSEQDVDEVVNNLQIVRHRSLLDE